MISKKTFKYGCVYVGAFTVPNELLRATHANYKLFLLLYLIFLDYRSCYLLTEFLTTRRSLW